MREYGWSQTATTLYRVIEPLVAAACTPFATRLLARYNARLVFSAACLLFGVASVGTAFATQLWQWDAYGVIYGITSAFFMYLAAPVIINRWFQTDAGMALGLTAAVLGVLAAVASPVAQSLIDADGWRVSRLVMCGVTLVVSVLLTLLFVRDAPETEGLRPHGFERAGVIKGLSNDASGGATLSRARRSAGLYLLMTIAGIVVLNAAFFQQIPAYAAEGRLGANAGAVAVSIIMVGGVVGKLLLGWLADRVGVIATAVGAQLCGGLGMGLAFAAGGSVSAFYIGMGLFGFGYAALTVVVPLLVRGAFGSAHYSDIFSWVSTAIFLASALSFLLFGEIVGLTGSFSWCFIIVIGLYVCGSLLVVPAVKSARATWSGEGVTDNV
jgi:MFS family permease